MTLIKSISGIRGTIGGKVGKNLTPVDVVKFVSAYGQLVKEEIAKSRYTIVIGRDARISGKMIQDLVINTLIGMGIDIINLNLSTTPTVEIAVKEEKADGGIIITASHNPEQWNALKFLNSKGEFLNAHKGKELVRLSESGNISFAPNSNIGSIFLNDNYFDKHIDLVLNLDLVNVDIIRKQKYKVVLDAVNSTGGLIIPKMLEKLNVNVIKLNCEPDGKFNHNPEPLKENLSDLSAKVISSGADFGIAVDPDVDRLAFIDNEGHMFGEEYTLVACADFVLSHKNGNTVSNLSSTRALSEITTKHGGNHYASAVGEVNVVEKMKATNSVIGGEGNGGIILPELHYGRDALVGIALFLNLLAEKKIKVSNLKKTYPIYFMSKKKLNLNPKFNFNQLIKLVKSKYGNQKISTVDGVKIDFPESWVHLRMSNTEPILRIYSEAKTQNEADELANDFMSEIREL